MGRHYLLPTMDAARVLGQQLAAARRGQRRTAEEVSERAGTTRATLRRIERGSFGFQHIRIAGLQSGVLTQLRGILSEQRYAFVVRLAHLRRIGDGVQMRDRAEHPAQAVAQFLDRHDQRGKSRIGLRRQLREARAILRQYLFQCRTSMAGLDTPEVRQSAQI